MAEKKSGFDRTEKWTVGLTVVSLMAGGIVFAGLVDRWSGSESDLVASTSVGTTSQAQEESPDPNSEYTYVTPTAVYPTTIPGCESVDALEEGGMSMISYMSNTAETYDDPRFPWFSESKASAMSAALASALPEHVQMKFASPSESLQFGPISAPSDSDELPEGMSIENMASTSASTTLIRDGKLGRLDVWLQRSSAPIPPCYAGSLVERRTLADGSVVDGQDTWSETNGVRTLSRSAILYGSDGTLVQANATDSVYQGGSGVEISGSVPLTVDELIALVSLPQLRTTAPVPVGTAPLKSDCQGSAIEPTGRELDRGTVDELGRALESGWRAAPPGMPSLEPALGALVLAASDNSTACQELVARSGSNEATLRISISSGQPLPKAPNKYDPSYDGHPISSITTADGSVVERDERHYAVMPMGNGDGASQSTSEQSRYVTLTRPSGAQVSVYSSASSPNSPMTFEQLEFLANIDGLEIR
ncbi:hypothetical protein [Rhodococcus sp. OK302]|uniref:hypothetical protein n=1 Tax=Rhodococcus sp. OK302 TaxID=1882769 RepID=UPI000B93F4FA|nr:hypothetical protein [Rhodococcus sp. OK302]OYD68928.1 hypothetical protein BDB13_2487 [Rhodococcus sp. OK302]